MARTFTGLKLQGQLGKFGKKEISDIEGYVELPDGKVLSGSEWGNMLLWDGGLIKVEIGRKNKKPCHNGSIQQIIMDEGELMSVGADGYIRVRHLIHIHRPLSDLTSQSFSYFWVCPSPVILKLMYRATLLSAFSHEKIPTSYNICHQIYSNHQLWLSMGI